MTPADALLSLSAIETAVYDPLLMPHAFEWTSPLCNRCKRCGASPGETGLCPDNPDWQACLIAADLCEDVLQDEALGAWWRWLHVERKVPTSPTADFWRTWDWWPPENGYERTRSPHAVLGWELYHRLAKGGSYDDHGIYSTRRAAYLDLARVYCDQWRQEHEMRKELAT